MNWYIVKIVFNIAHQNNKPSNEFDEQFRLIEAHNEEEAFLKARFIGVKNENSFENIEGETINWNFIDVAYVKELDSLKDGLELFSTTHEAEDPLSYMRFVQHQAENIYDRILPHGVSVD